MRKDNNIKVLQPVTPRLMLYWNAYIKPLETSYTPQGAEHGTWWHQPLGQYTSCRHICNMCNSTQVFTAYTPVQLVFGSDSIMDICHEGIECENHNWAEHTYKTGDKILLKKVWKTKYNQDTYIGSYTITAADPTAAYVTIVL